MINKVNKFINLIKKLYVAVTKTPKHLSFCHSILLHVSLVIGFIIISSMLQTKKNVLNLARGLAVVKLYNHEIMQGTVISSKNINKQVVAFEEKQQKLGKQMLLKEHERQQKSKVIEQRIAAAYASKIKHQEELKAAKISKKKELAEAKLQAEEEAFSKKEQKQKRLAQEKAKELKVQQEDKKARKAKEEAVLRAQAKKNAQVEKEAKESKLLAAGKAALDALRESALNDLDAEIAEASAQSETEKALQAYVSAYKVRIEAVWIIDDCQKISTEHLPTVMVMAGSNPIISVSSNSTQCDRSLLLAFKNGKVPTLPKDARARELIAQGIDFKFG